MLKDERRALDRVWFFRVPDVAIVLTVSTAARVDDSRCRSAGYSLIELMVTIAVAAILLATAIPTFSNLMAQNELAVASNAARGALMVARETAVMRGHPVSLCAGEPSSGCSGDWSGGQWLVFRDANHSGDLDAGETVLQHGRVPGASQAVSIDGNGPLRSALVYMPLGHAERISGAFGAGRLRLCVTRDIASNARELVISASGRVRMQRVDFSGACPPL